MHAVSGAGECAVERANSHIAATKLGLYALKPYPRIVNVDAQCLDAAQKTFWFVVNGEVCRPWGLHCFCRLVYVSSARGEF